ncbi:MAG: pilus assembly protein CpaF [Anaerolineaceae bacterium]|nr:MAG: pilus assembly protein CpaF [Anaerolineaceae bacterium]
MSDILRVTPTTLQDPRMLKLKGILMNTVAQEMQKHPLPQQQNRAIVRQWLVDALDRAGVDNMPADVRTQVLESALADLIGYGPLELLLSDPYTSEIMVNGAKQVFIERNGELLETDVAFLDDEHVLRIINRIVNPLGRRVDPDNPTADARLPDGSRVNVAIPPVAVDGPTITIRKFLETKMTLEDLMERGALTPYMAKFLEACVKARLNILITGNTSSGKTTMLNLLSGFIPDRERIVTIEDAVELKLKQRHVVRLETKLPSVDGSGGVTVRDLVRNALRMRPDRIVVGEVRGGESMDMLQAMNTGHTGSLTTLHANTPRDATARLETMAMMAGLEMPLLAIRRQIAAAINLVVHLTRLQDGSRKMTHITEVSGMEGDVITLSDIFKFEQTGISPDGKVQGQLRPTGLRPLFTPRLEVAGFKLGGEIFGVGI